MNKRLILAFLAVVAISGAAIYFYLGGLNKVAITVENVADYHLVGIRFKGEGGSDSLRNAFFEARGYVENGRLSGTLTLLHYRDTTLEKGRVNVFVGIRLNGGTSDLPAHYQRLTIPAQRAVRATIQAHNSVMPNAQTIEERLLAKAEELRLELQGFTIEQYLSERELRIDMPVRQ